MNPWLGMALVLGLLTVLMVSVKVAQRRAGLHPEWARKLVHLGLGLTALSFPWLFRAPWPVLLLEAFILGVLVLLRSWSPARALLGGVVDSVPRRSQGEFYFPMAVALLFLVSHGDPLRYGIPMLVLTLADAAAALVGLHCGRTPYTTSEGHKSLEGSLAFFLVAFFAIYVPLQRYASPGGAPILAKSATVALALTLLEAAAWGGLDNLFIPLGGYLLLGQYQGLGLAGQLTHLAILTGWVTLAMLMRRRSRLNDSTLLGAALAVYASLLGGGFVRQLIVSMR